MTTGVPMSSPATAARDESAAGDSISVAGWTMVSRVTGVAKIAVIGAVLGPTIFGNAYQFTNSLPNLVYFGLLAGSLFSSLLVPALVEHVDAGDGEASARVAGGFLGMTLLALVAVVPLAILLGPLALRSAAGSASAAQAGAQEHVGRYLILMFAPQVFLYGVVGTSSAAMNAHRRFALAAAAPAMENLGTIAVLAAVAIMFGTRSGVSDVSTGELLLLGLGTTAAVALHAGTQWWGARRSGVLLVPRPGWRDPEVRVVVRRSVPSMAQAGLVALQMLVLLVIANRVAGGVVAFQIALNFYFVAIALAATPVALSLLPRLARMHLDGDDAAFRGTLAHGYALGLFFAVPAAVGLLVLASPLAHAVSFGRMGSAGGVALVTAALVALAAAVIAQTIFLIATYASYARKDTRTPLVSMAWQALTCLALAGVAFTVHGTAVPLILGIALTVSIVVSSAHLTTRLRHAVGTSRSGLAPSLARTLFGAALMAGPAWLVASQISRWLGPPFGSRLAILAGAAVGAGVFLASQAMLGTPELRWLGAGIGQLHSRSRSRALVAGAGDG